MRLLTKEGYSKLKESLLELQARRIIVEKALQEARQQGDLSENAGYHISKADLRNIDKRIAEIMNVLQTHPIAVHKDVEDSKVIFGMYIKVLDLNQSKERVFRIVSEHELMFLTEENVDLLTSKSLVAGALIGRGLNECISIETHAGVREYTVLKLSKNLADL